MFNWGDDEFVELECRYLLAIAILSSLYTGAQAFRQIQELSTGKQMIKPSVAAIIDFFGDQVCNLNSFLYGVTLFSMRL
jgi:hypothetical protein